MIIFDSGLTHDIEELGYTVELSPDSGAEVCFTKGAHKIEIYRNDGEWFIFSESTRRRKTDEGYYENESVGLSNTEINIVNDMLQKAEFRIKMNGG